MASSFDDYGSELQELQRSSGGGSHYFRGSSQYLRSSSSGYYEAEDLEQPTRHHGGHHRDRGYYSPPGTSYTIVERPPSAPHHHSSHATPYKHHRGHHPVGGSGPVGPISPEQVIKLFSNTSHSSDRRQNERRTPASSPASVAALRNSSNSSQQNSNSQTSPSQPQQLSLQELTVRTITMTRDSADSHHGFGICVKGGKDAGVGVYISRVEEGSIAERAGLRPGDTILEVNGTPFRAVTHEEALKMLKSCRTLSMTVRGPALDPRCRGGHPVWTSSSNRQQTCSWMDRQGRPTSPPPPPSSSRDPRCGPRTRRVDMLIEPGQSLGLMIRGGLEYGLGIYVTGVDKDSVADRVGLMVGDQIIEVNGQSFEEATHDEAVQILKTNKRMSMLIRDVGKVPHSCTTSQPMIMPVSRYQDHDSLFLDSPANHRPPSPASSVSDWRHGRGGGGYHSVSSATLAMVEEKARVVLARSERAALSQLLADYRARRLNIEDLVVNLGDLLNTHEKLTLLTELRELIDVKDRAIFDELVYRPRNSRRKCDIGLHSDLIVTPSLHDLPDYEDDIMSDRGRRHSSPGGSRRNRDYDHRLQSNNLDCEGDYEGSEMTIGSDGRRYDRDRETEEDEDEGLRDERNSENDGGGGFGGWKSNLLGGLTQRVKSWYWGSSPLDIAQKLSRSFDMQEAQMMDEAGNPAGKGQKKRPANPEDAAVVVPDNQGNLRIVIKKAKPTLGIVIEGGSDTKHPLPRIIHIHEGGSAYEAGGLEIGQLILEVERQKLQALTHAEVAKVIAESFARRDRNEIEFLVVEAKKSNLEPKPTALIYLEA